MSLNYEFLFVAGLVLLVLELFVLGLSGWVLALALGVLSTSALMFFGWIDPAASTATVLISVSVLSTIVAGLLYPYFKRRQNAPAEADNSSDLIGQTLKVKTAVTEHDGEVYYSDIAMQARVYPGTSDALEPGSFVKVSGVNGNILIVSPVKPA